MPAETVESPPDPDSAIIKTPGQYSEAYLGDWSALPTGKDIPRMDPATRTLLRVRIEDMGETDQIFSVLMGTEVEPRRQFIETNALSVKQLDV